MPPDRPVRSLTASAGAGLVALLVVAATAGGGGLLAHGSTPAPGSANALRGLGVAAAVAALVVLARQPDVGLRRSPAVLVTAAVVLGTITLLTLPVSDVDWTLPSRDRIRLEPPPEEPAAPPAAEAEAAPPPVLRLPASGHLEVRSHELWLIVPGEGEAPLGSAGGAGTPIGPGVTADLRLDPDGGVSVVGGDGSTLATTGPDGPPLDLGDTRIEDTAGNGVAEVGDGSVTDLGGGATGRLQLAPPSAEDERAQDWLASAAGVVLAAGVYWMVFIRAGRRRPPAARPDELDGTAEADADDARVPDPGAAAAGVRATLDAMLADPDPRTAIVGAYAVLLTALEAAGLGRRPEEAPHEHLDRALAPLGPLAARVHELADLFVLARFGGAPLADEHRDAAIAALRAALDDRLVPA